MAVITAIDKETSRIKRETAQMWDTYHSTTIPDNALVAYIKRNFGSVVFELYLQMLFKASIAEGWFSLLILEPLQRSDETTNELLRDIQLYPHRAMDAMERLAAQCPRDEGHGGEDGEGVARDRGDEHHGPGKFSIHLFRQQNPHCHSVPAGPRQGKKPDR